jgi:hypothetical protein
MLKFFRNNNILMTLVYFIIAGVFSSQIPSDLMKSIDFHNQAVFYKFILSLLQGQYFLLFYKLLSGIFIAIIGLMFNKLLFNSGLSKSFNYFQGFILIFFLGLTALKTELLSVLICLTFFIIALKGIFKTIKKQDALFDYFNAGLILSVMIFFWATSVYFFFIIFICLFILRSFNWREWLVSLIGLSLPVFLFISVYFLVFSNIDIVFNYHKLFKHNVVQFDFSNSFKIGAIYISLLALVSSVQIIGRFNSSETVVQDFYKVFFILFLLSLITIFINQADILPVFAYGFLAFTIPVSRIFLNLKKKIFAEIMFDFFLLSIIFMAMEI